MRIIVFTFCILCPLLLQAQSCDCLTQFVFVQEYFEKNNPAFQQLKSRPDAYRAYASAVQDLLLQAAKEKDEDKCSVYFSAYVALLKDHHSNTGFRLERQSFETDEDIRRFREAIPPGTYAKMETDTAQLTASLQKKEISAVEGIYTNGGTLFLGIVKKPGAKDAYTGVVLQNTKFLDVGHVLLELQRKKDGTFDAIYYTGLLGFNFQRLHCTFSIANGQIPYLGFYKTSSVAPDDIKPYEYRALDDSTGYLRLSNFDGELTAELDSFYLTLQPVLSRTPYLVIDLRNNGGGSEQSYFNLLPYIYTRPLQVDSVEVWVSPENILRYEENFSGNTELVRRMKEATPYTFIPFSENGMHTWTLDSLSALPRRIALLYNRGTASAAEGMITYAIQSDKVITIGENSGGYIGYGNVTTAQTPCGKYTIASTTMKYSRNSQYEFVGIPPMYRVSPHKDWVAYAMKLLKRGKHAYP